MWNCPFAAPYPVVNPINKYTTHATRQNLWPCSYWVPVPNATVEIASSRSAGQKFRNWSSDVLLVLVAQEELLYTDSPSSFV